MEKFPFLFYEISKKGLTLKKVKSRRYPTETMTDADYTNDLTLLGNTTVQAEYLLYSVKPAAKAIGLYVNSDKTESMRLNQDGAMSSWNGTPLKLVDQFTILGSNISSIASENNIDVSLLLRSY